jgi:hypothetical protein
VLHHYQVGQPYGGVRRQWPERVIYRYQSGGHTLTAFLPDPSPEEVMAYRKGRAEFALLAAPPEAPDIILFLFRFGGEEWGDSPYSIHLAAIEQGSPVELPAPLSAPDDATYRMILNITLVDGNDGTIKALRVSSFSPAFTRALHAALIDQAARPYPGDAEYNRQLDAAYRRWPTTDAMLRSASIRCSGGD